ncbi:MAG: DUF1587 domain-containing protein, partial [Verrucomicrobiota bacterium]
MPEVRRLRRITFGLCLVNIAIFSGLGVFHTQSKPSEQKLYDASVEPILARYCYDCHDTDTEKAGLALDVFTNLTSILEHREVWENVAFNIGNHLMPPIHKKQPTKAERKAILDWIEQHVFLRDCETPSPGHVTLRRLNREEYNNTIHDLVGVDFRPADDFPPDDSGYGFDNIGDVLTLSPTLLDKYLKAAEQILDEAIVTKRPEPASVRVDAGQFKGRYPNGRLTSQGEVRIDVDLPATGEYDIRVLAEADQAGPEKAKMNIEVQGQKSRHVTIQEHRKETWHSFKTTLDAGRRHVKVWFLNDYYNPKSRTPRERDRNLLVHRIEVNGPLNLPPPEPPPSHKKILVCLPDDASKAEACAKQVIEQFAYRAYRRPVAPA